MKLYMKQKAFSLKDKFTIMDEHGDIRYTVEGEFWTFGKKLHVYDHEDNEVAFLKEVVMALMHTFEVYVEEQQIATIRQRFSWTRSKYEIEGLNWYVDGNWTGHEYEISDDSRVIVSVQKEWMTWGDSYEIDIRDPLDEVNALAVVLAIDAVLAAQAAAAAA
ncbi:MAG: LURP-one-related family protein [Solobacterium sp.]|nr:LURP-one-related family protein [Solobacterium sp.]